MRFKTRYDVWLVVMLSVVAFLMIGMPSALYLTHVVRGAPMLLFLFGPAIMAIVLSLTLPQYHELREDGMFIRQGWKRALLSYDALRDLRADTGVMSAPVFSTHRIYLTVVSAGEWVIAVADEEKFLAEVRRRAPQLQRVSGGQGSHTKNGPS
jgi:hypothetical protein